MVLLASTKGRRVRADRRSCSATLREVVGDGMTTGGFSATARARRMKPASPRRADVPSCESRFSLVFTNAEHHRPWCFDAAPDAIRPGHDTPGEV